MDARDVNSVIDVERGGSAAAFDSVLGARDGEDCL